LREIIGAVDSIVAKPRLQFLGDERGAELFRSRGSRLRRRICALAGARRSFGEGLLLDTHLRK